MSTTVEEQTWLITVASQENAEAYIVTEKSLPEACSEAESRFSEEHPHEVKGVQNTQEWGDD